MWSSMGVYHWKMPIDAASRKRDIESSMSFALDAVIYRPLSKDQMVELIELNIDIDKEAVDRILVSHDDAPEVDLMGDGND
jgi:hypothetical protein